MPLTAAMIGFQRSFDLGPTFSPGSSKWNGVSELPPPGTAEVRLMSSGSSHAPMTSSRSIPVQNAFSPAPVSTTQRTSSSWRMLRHRCFSSDCIWWLNALCTSGRFSVTHATPSRTSYSSVS